MGHSLSVDEAERQRHVQQIQQRQHYTDETTAMTLPPNCHQTHRTPDDCNYIQAALPASLPVFHVPVTTYSIPPVQGSSAGVQPQMSSILSAPTVAQPLAQPRSSVAIPSVHINSSLPDQVNVAPPAAVFTTPGTFLYTLGLI